MASINRGDNTGAFGQDFLRIYLNNPNELYITKAVFQINGNLEKEFDEPKFPLRINFTGAETELLAQVNTCKLALWDEYGRRRTADGKFTFFCKENRINSPDAPLYDGDEYYPEDTNTVYFDLEDAEFACEFVINATPTKMSELQQDIELMKPENIIGGTNVRTQRDGHGNVIISAELDAKQSYNDLTDKPSINGQELIGDIEIHLENVPQSDWNETDATKPEYIKNKPQLKTVALTGSYSDLINQPTIPTKVSDIENDLNFIDKNIEDLTNYYTKPEVDALVRHDIDFKPVYDKIDEVQEELQTEIDGLQEDKVDNETLDTIVTRLENKDDVLSYELTTAVNSITSELQYKATKEEVNELAAIVDTVITQEDLDDALALKADKTEIGNGRLSIRVNDNQIGQFTSNQKENSSVNIEVPTKVSQLENDSLFVTADEISLDTLATKQELNDGLGTKVNLSQLGDGITTIKVNGVSKGSINANQSTNKEINIVTPLKLSDLEQDIDYLEEEDLSAINEQISALQSDSDIFAERLNDFEGALDNKVTISNTKSMVDNTEINRLRNVDNYDDTAINNRVDILQTKIDNFDGDISNKVDKVDGKGLSTNDFTDSYKDKVDNAYTLSQVTAGELAHTQATVDDLALEVPEIATDVNGIHVTLNDEINARSNADNELQSQIEALEAKSTVVDILQNVSDLEGYDKSHLQLNDVICILTDETKHNTVSYYRWNGSDFTYVGSEGVYYTRSQSDERFVNREFEINGYPLTTNFQLTYQDVNALPADTFISNRTIVIQVNDNQIEEFTLNQDVNTVVNIPVPTLVSELSNDLYYVTENVLEQTYLGWPDPNYGDGENTRLWDKAYRLEDRIKVNEDKIARLEGGLPEVALTGNYYDLNHLPTTISSNYKTIVNDSTYTGYIDNTFIQEFKAKAQYLTEDDLDFSTYAKRSEIPTRVSQLENDRGYVTTNALGRSDLTIYLGNTQLGIFNANSKEDVSIEIPVDTELDATSDNLVTNKAIATELNKKVDGTSVVHIAQDETITGNKTFSGNLIAVTQSNSDNSTKVATTAFVKNQGYATDNLVAHLASSETFTGNKTFSGKVVLSEATGKTMATNDNSTNLATTAFVKNQGYAVDANVVHDGGTETINGDKTFAETTTFQGITYLGDYAHVGTPDGNTQDAVVNVAYLQSVIQQLIQRIEVLEGYHS